MRKLGFILVIMPIVFQIGALLFIWPRWITGPEGPVVIFPYMFYGLIVMVICLRIIVVLNRKMTRTTIMPQKGP